MRLTFQLPPETLIEHNRNTRQVSYLLWELSRRARSSSRRLCAQATDLTRASRALGARQPRGTPAPS